MEESNNEALGSWLALGVVIIGTFMSILDSSIVNIALPKMMAVFGMPLDDAKWILTSYTLALGAIIPLTGYLQDIFGSKRIYMFALAMFTLGSLLCEHTRCKTKAAGLLRDRPPCFDLNMVSLHPSTLASEPGFGRHRTSRCRD